MNWVKASESPPPREDWHRILGWYYHHTYPQTMMWEPNEEAWINSREWELSTLCDIEPLIYMDDPDLWCELPNREAAHEQYWKTQL